jgi:hypothetical protein
MASQQRRCQSRAAGSQKTLPFISVPPSEATDGGVSMTEEEPVLTPAREEGTGHDEDRVGSRTLVSANTGYGFPVPQYCNYDGPPHVFSNFRNGLRRFWGPPPIQQTKTFVVVCCGAGLDLTGPGHQRPDRDRQQTWLLCNARSGV